MKMKERFLFFHFSFNKENKCFILQAIVKSLTGLVVNCCKDHFARRLLFAIFDVVDDTKRVNKLITQVIAENLSDLIYNKSAVWVLHYLVRPRDHHVFGKGLIEILQKV
jgi:hypothetical protein